MNAVAERPKAAARAAACAKPHRPEPAESAKVENLPENPDTAAELAYYRLNEANAVLCAAGEDHVDNGLGDALRAAASVAGQARDCIPLGEPVTWQRLSTAGALLSQAEAVVNLVTRESDNLLALAGHTLLQIAQEQISTAEGEVHDA